MIQRPAYKLRFDHRIASTCSDVTITRQDRNKQRPQQSITHRTLHTIHHTYCERVNNLFFPFARLLQFIFVLLDLRFFSQRFFPTFLFPIRSSVQPVCTLNSNYAIIGIIIFSIRSVQQQKNHLRFYACNSVFPYLRISIKGNKRILNID